jgi:hypothetical protein
MHNADSIIDALLADVPSNPLSGAIAQARKRKTRRRRLQAAAVLTALLLLVGGFGILTNPRHNEPSAALHSFSTAETTFSLRQFSTQEVPDRLALFSNEDVRWAIRDIDDKALLSLLHPYQPVIVYRGVGQRPSLLLLAPPAGQKN